MSLPGSPDSIPKFSRGRTVRVSNWHNGRAAPYVETWEEPHLPNSVGWHNGRAAPFVTHADDPDLPNPREPLEDLLDVNLPTELSEDANALPGVGERLQVTQRLSFDATLQGVGAFLDVAGAVHAKWESKDNVAVARALDRREAELSNEAAQIDDLVAPECDVLFPLIESGEALPEGTVTSLNTALETFKQGSEIIPAKLAGAKPGEKLFVGLANKVEKVCSMNEDAWKGKLRESLEARLRSSGQDSALDAERQAIKAEREHALWQAASESALALAQSDHQPIYETVKFSDESSWDLMSWNTLEFPMLDGEADGVLKGIKPVRGAYLSLLGRKDATLQHLLLQAMSSRPVVELHTTLILQKVREAFLERNVQTVLLQEINHDLQALLQNQADAEGWHVHFSKANPGPEKCDAITCVISLKPFDEVSELECTEGGPGKERYFAAVRQGPVWTVSSHTPGGPTRDAEKSTRIFRKIAETFITGSSSGSVTHLVAGGDWNTDVRTLESNLVAEPSFSQIDVQAPDEATIVDRVYPIDAVLLAHRL